jgi:anti-anti-sigma regulatory factor
MLTVNKQQSKVGLLVELSGAIEESVHFDQLFGSFNGELIVNCRSVTRINSVGVKTWIRYFQSLQAAGKKFKFVELSYPLVEQLNMISNFACNGEVESILLPFSCIQCQKEFMAPMKTADLKNNGLQIPNVKCEKDVCGARFDDDPEEYLYFLED